MDRFLSIEAFVRVAQARSFAEAARQLRLSKSVVTAGATAVVGVVGQVVPWPAIDAMRECRQMKSEWVDVGARIAPWCLR